MPFVRRTRATLRSAEFGFFGVVVYTRVQTPRFCGDCCSAGTFLRDFCTTRGLAISWLIVGIVHPCSRETAFGSANFVRDHLPHRPHRANSTRAKRNRANRSLPSGKRFDATEDRDRHRSAVAAQPVPRSCIRNQSRENVLKRTKIVLALPSFDRQRLSGIRRGW